MAESETDRGARPVAGESPPEAQAGEEAPRLEKALIRTREGLLSRLGRAIRGRRIDENVLEEIEEALLGADVGVTITTRLIGVLEQRMRRGEARDREGLLALLGQSVRGILEEAASRMPRAGMPKEGLVARVRSGPRPYGIMVVGVNGVGKTTTIGKLAALLEREGLDVLIAAGDTFRAGAIEQLAIWGERVGAEVIRSQAGSDSGAVVFDAVRAAVARRRAVVIADTAGRLHTKTKLMEELRKVKGVMEKAASGMPHEVLLVLDATTGQNAVEQAREFHGALGVTSVAMAKLDGTARGGTLIAIAGDLGLPVELVGLGESAGSLREFDAAEYVKGLFE